MPQIFLAWVVTKMSWSDAASSAGLQTRDLPAASACRRGDNSFITLERRSDATYDGDLRPTTSAATSRR